MKEEPLPDADAEREREILTAKRDLIQRHLEHMIEELDPELRPTMSMLVLTWTYPNGLMRTACTKPDDEPDDWGNRAIALASALNMCLLSEMGNVKTPEMRNVLRSHVAARMPILAPEIREGGDLFGKDAGPGLVGPGGRPLT